MDLKDIISISGKSGLFSVIGKSKNNVIVESITDKKRFPIFNSNKISALSDISIYTYDKEILLSDVYRKIYKSNEGKATISYKEDISNLRKKLEELVPNYDKEQVYNSDIKKLFQWYNILHETKKLKLKEEEKKEDKEETKKISANSSIKTKSKTTKQKPKLTSNQVPKKTQRTQRKSG